MQHIEDGLAAVANGGSISASGAITLTPGTGGSGAVQVKPPSGDALAIYQSDGVSLNARWTDSTPGAAQLIFYGANGAGQNKQVCAIGLDSAKPGAPGQDFTIYTRINADGSNSDPDGLYVTNPATADSSHPSAFAFGLSTPPTAYRLHVQGSAGDLTQGGLIVLANPSTTGKPFVVLAGNSETTSDSAFEVRADFSASWKANPSNRTVADGATNSNTTVTSATANFTAADKGSYITGTGIPSGTYIAAVTNSTTVTISQAATATATGVSLTIVVPHFKFRMWGESPLLIGHIGSGAGAVSIPVITGIGPGAPATPTATLDIAQISTTAATLKVRSITTGNSILLQANGSGSTASIWTQAATSLALGTNGAAVINMGTAGQLGFFGATAIAKPSAAGTATGYAAGATAATFHSDDTYTGNVGTTGYTINGIVAALKNLGLIAT